MSNSVIDDKSVVAKLEEFDNAIASSEKFEIKGINEEKGCFVIRDTSKQKGIYGIYIEVPIKEVIGKPLDQLMDVLNLKRKDVTLEGVTRIVGYYSRVSNWNKSKVGELRDRSQRNYNVTAYSPKFEAERAKVINSL